MRPSNTGNAAEFEALFAELDALTGTVKKPIRDPAAATLTVSARFYPGRFEKCGSVPSMKFGLFDHLDADGGAISRLYSNRLAFYRRCDEADFYALHVAEHHATPLGVAPSPNVFLAALAQHTQNLRFGAMVYCLPFYHPVRLLEEICMLDQLSGGRVELGVGRGISPFEGQYLGVLPEEGAARFEEALDLILQGLQKPELTYAGRYYQLTDMPVILRPIQQPHPPLWYGVVTGARAEFCAQQGMNILTNRAGAAANAIAEAYRNTWQRVQPSTTPLGLMGITRHIVIDNDQQRAQANFAEAYQRWRHGFYALWRRHNASPPNVHLPEEPVGFIEAGQAIVGSPEYVAEQVASHIETAGVNYFVARFAFGNLSENTINRSLDLFVEKVMPHF